MMIRSIGIGLFWICALAAGLWVAELVAPQPVVLVIPIYNAISNGTADNVERALTDAIVDPAVAAIVMVIDSGGGDVIASERIYHAVLNARRTKPVFSFVSGFAQSGGYYIASATQAIFAPASSKVGSVGVLYRRDYRDPPFNTAWYFSAPYKLGSTRFETIQHLDLDKGAFAESVYQRRLAAPNPITLTLAELSEARTYLGREALALGLIDSIGGRMNAIEAAAEGAGVADFQIVEAEIFNFWSLFSSDILQSDPATPPTTTPAAEGE